MDNLRDFLKSWPGRILLMLCLLPLALMGMESIFGRSHDPNTVLTVADMRVSVSEYQAELSALRARLPDLTESQLKTRALENLTNQALLRVHAQRLGVHYSDETITRLLQSEPQFLDANGRFSNDLFANFLTQNGLTKDRLFTRFNDDNALNEMLAVANSAIMPQMLVKKMLEQDTKTRPMQLKRLDLKDYLADVKISEDAIKSEFAKGVMSDEMVDVAVVELLPSALNATLNDTDWQEAYARYSADNPQSFSHILFTGKDAQARAAEAKAKLDGGADFAELAKISDDPSGKAGGKLGRLDFTMFGDDAKNVQSAVQNLSVGQTSAPVKTPFGYHIFKLDSSDVLSFKDFQAKNADAVLAQKRQALFLDTVAQINQKLADGVSLKRLAQEKNLPITEQKDVPKPAHTDNKVLTAAFDPDALDGTSSAIMQGDGAIWVAPSNHRAPRTLTLDEARPILTQRLQQAAARKLAYQDAQNLAKTLDKDNANDLKAKEFVDFGVIGAGFSLLTPNERLNLFTQNGVVALEDEHGASIMVLGDVVQTPMSADELAKASVALATLAGQAQLEAWLKHLRTLYDVKINENAAI